MPATPHHYLDWAATAPLCAEARAAMLAAADRLADGQWANPSSVHGPGRAARQAREEARASIARFLDVPTDAIIFTSGGTEALGLAVGGTEASALLVGATEHVAVKAAAAGASILPVDADGRILPDALEAALNRAGDRPLVVVQHANNETGVVQDVAAIAAIVHAAGGRLLVDAVQSAGKLPLPAAADMLAVSAHKLGGPAGIGALVLRCRDGLRAVQPGGGQERGLRGGTENLLGIIGFAAAVQSLPEGWVTRCGMLKARLEAAVEEVGGHINAAGAERLPTISSIHLPGIPAATQLMALDLAGVAVSQGAACSSGTLKPSETLLAMGLKAEARESLRVSLGWATRAADIDAFLAAWTPLARRVRHAA